MNVRLLEDREGIREAIRTHALSWQSAYDDILPGDILDGMTVDPDPEDVDEWLDRFPDESVTLGADIDGSVRGYIHVRWADTKPFVRADEANLKELYVRPGWWGEGVGTALFEAARECVPPDVTGMALDVFADNAWARGFYEACGFEADERGTIEVAGETYETVIYRQPFDA